VYSSVPPLFRVTTKKNEYVYLKDQDALEEYKRKHGKEIAFIGREKGLGEMDGATEISYCLLDPKTRTILRLDVDDVDKTNELFETLYGKAVEPRVDYLMEHGEEARVE
jgi:DNA gyrase subunit B